MKHVLYIFLKIYIIKKMQRSTRNEIDDSISVVMDNKNSLYISFKKKIYNDKKIYKLFIQEDKKLITKVFVSSDRLSEYLNKMLGLLQGYPRNVTDFILKIMTYI